MTAIDGRGGNSSQGADNPEQDGPCDVGGGGGVIYVSSGAVGTTSARLSGGILTTQSVNPGDPPSGDLARYYARAGFDGLSGNISVPITSTGAHAAAACLPILAVSKSTSTASITACGATTANYSINVQIQFLGWSARFNLRVM